MALHLAKRLVASALTLALAYLAWSDASITQGQASPPPGLPPSSQTSAGLALAMIDRADPLGAQAEAGQTSHRAGIARASLQTNALDAAALRQLALAQPNRASDQTASLLALSERVSRRDLATQILLFERDLAREDYRAAFTHIDRVLAVRPAAQDETTLKLVPLLMLDHARTALSLYRRRSWFETLLRQAVAQPGYLTATRALIDAAKPDLADPDNPVLPALINRYVERGEYSEARRAALLLGGFDASMLDDFALTEHTRDPRLGLLAWRGGQGDVATVAWDDAGAAQIEVQSGHAASVLQRLIVGSAGPLTLSFRVAPDPVSPAPQLRWMVSCADPVASTLAWQQPIPPVDRPVQFSASLVVSGCPAQVWQLQAVAADSQSASRITLDRLALSRGTGSGSAFGRQD